MKRYAPFLIIFSALMLMTVVFVVVWSFLSSPTIYKVDHPGRCTSDQVIHHRCR